MWSFLISVGCLKEALKCRKWNDRFTPVSLWLFKVDLFIRQQKQVRFPMGEATCFFLGAVYNGDRQEGPGFARNAECIMKKKEGGRGFFASPRSKSFRAVETPAPTPSE
jgi:hypothetical protein